VDALDRIVFEIKDEGEAFELDPKMPVYLSAQLRLNDEQIKLVVGLARRVAGASRKEM
jgi:hypothetical protein